MEAALVSVATGALKPVLEKLGVLLGEKYKRFKGVRKEIMSLTHELTAMDAFLVKMSEAEEPDVQDKVWMNEVRELSYDMEDCIDDFMQSLDEKDTKPEGFIEKIKHSLGKMKDLKPEGFIEMIKHTLGKMKARRRIGNEIEDLKNQIIEVGARNARYKTRQAYTSTKNATIDPRALVIFEHASNLVGIDEPKAEIIKSLIEEDLRSPTQQQLKIVSIVGPGGMGKTTLANQVYQELKGRFNCRAFLSVSRNPDMVNILRTILSKVSNQHYGNTEEGSVQQLIMSINDFLLDKRYFIVVDDIWDVKTWDVIKRAFPINNSGSIIITTTRMNNVAQSCCSSFDGHVYKIRHLDMVHSRQLFHRRLFTSEENCPSYLKEVVEQILEKCAGLPLAIIAISGLLANAEEEEDLWNQVKDSIGRALERNASVELMMKILSLSYYDLPAHLKTCLLYLCMYPEDSIIEKKELIRRWIAEGFIQKEYRYTAHELGARYFNELINRSLMQPVRTNQYGKLKSCRVHDTVLDFIISKSIEENFVTSIGVPNLSVGTEGKVRRLPLQADQQGNCILPTGLVLSHVRSLSVPRAWSEIPHLVEFGHLHVLHFDIYVPLRNHHFANIGRLLKLRYLNLRKSGPSELPEQIGDLGCLEMLDLRHTRISKLPATIVNLKKLVDLLVESGVYFPDGIAKMQSLEVLKWVAVSKQPINFLFELGQLKNLRKLALDFEKLNSIGYTIGVGECKKVIFTSLHKLGTQNLRSLKMVSEDIILEGFIEKVILEGPSFPTPLRLQKTKLCFSALSCVPNWVGSLVNLRQLCLQVNEVGEEGLCILGRLRALLILDLQLAQENSGDKHLTISGGIGFRCLRQFFYQTYGVPDLVFTEGSMPKLQMLELTFHAAKSGFCCDFGIENLPSLDALTCKVRSWYSKAETAKSAQTEAAKSAMERAVRTHPNRPTLLFEILPPSQSVRLGYED